MSRGPLTAFLTALLMGASLWGQEAYFEEDKPKPWVPAWELSLRADQVKGVGDEAVLLNRSLARLRLRWDFVQGVWSGALGTWAGVGSDGNRFNIPRYDQQPSNGVRLDSAWIQLGLRSEAGFAELRLGHQENPLLTQESLWDKDLRITGASARLAWRSERVNELGLRAVVGRVRTVPDGRVMLQGVQALAAFGTGELDWVFHASRWTIGFDPSTARESAYPGLVKDARQELSLEAYGAGLTWHARLPVELKAYQHRDPITGEDGGEVQAWLGSRNRVWWPQFGWIYQRFDRRGTFHPLNGDDWWFMWNARGPRYEMALPLPRRWLLIATVLRHNPYEGPAYPIERRMLQLVKRF